MFSFHRPKVYRSPTGCCICKAKSSSSRFTDSKKYEEDFLECFKLATPRQGEICNACVLLVKRWKKLPAGSDRNWQHVVDARAGPGMKSFTKFKTKNKKLNGDKIKKKHFVREYSPALSDKSDAPEDMDINDMDFLSEDGPSMDSSRTGSPGASDNEDAVMQKSRSRRRKAISRRRDETQQNVSGFIDLDYWKQETVCCGTIFRGQHNEIMVDPSYIKPCLGRIALCKAKALSQSSPSNSPDAPVKGMYSDSSSDSGYDDYSNQGMIMSPENALNHVLEHGSVVGEQGNHIPQQRNLIIVPGNPVILQGNHVAEQRNLVIDQGNPVILQGNHVAEQRNRVIAQGNPVILQGNHVAEQRNLVIAQGNQVIAQRNLVDRRVTDLRCHETMFKRQEVPLAVREVQLSSGMILSGGNIAGCYNETQQTTVKN